MLRNVTKQIQVTRFCSTIQAILGSLSLITGLRDALEGLKNRCKLIQFAFQKYSTVYSVKKPLKSSIQDKRNRCCCRSLGRIGLAAGAWGGGKERINETFKRKRWNTIGAISSMCGLRLLTKEQIEANGQNPSLWFKQNVWVFKKAAMDKKTYEIYWNI